MNGFAPSLYDRIQAAGGQEAYNQQQLDEDAKRQLMQEQARMLAVQEQAMQQKMQNDYWAQREADRNPWKGQTFNQMAADPGSPAFETVDPNTGIAARDMAHAGIEMSVGPKGVPVPGPVTPGPGKQYMDFGPPPPIAEQPDWTRRLKTGEEREAMESGTRGSGYNYSAAKEIFDAKSSSLDKKYTRVGDMTPAQVAREFQKPKEAVLADIDNERQEAARTLQTAGSAASRQVAGAPTKIGTRQPRSAIKIEPSTGAPAAGNAPINVDMNDPQMAARVKEHEALLKNPDYLKTLASVQQSKAAANQSSGASTPIVNGTVKPATPPQAATANPEDRTVVKTGMLNKNPTPTWFTGGPAIAPSPDWVLGQRLPQLPKVAAPEPFRRASGPSFGGMFNSAAEGIYEGVGNAYEGASGTLADLIYRGQRGRGSY